MLAKCHIQFNTHKTSVLVNGELERIQVFKYDAANNCEWESFSFDEQDEIADYMFKAPNQLHYVITWHDQ